MLITHLHTLKRLFYVDVIVMSDMDPNYGMCTFSVTRTGSLRVCLVSFVKF